MTNISLAVSRYLENPAYRAWSAAYVPGKSVDDDVHELLAVVGIGFPYECVWLSLRSHGSRATTKAIRAAHAKQTERVGLRLVRK